MFVDDESAMVRYCKRLLERFHFDLVITDMAMPGLTGDKLAREMMKIRAEIPVVLCTGYSEMLDEKQALELGIKAFHMKPFDGMELAHTIRIVLDGGKKDEPDIDNVAAMSR